MGGGIAGAKAQQPMLSRTPLKSTVRGTGRSDPIGSRGIFNRSRPKIAPQTSTPPLTPRSTSSAKTSVKQQPAQQAPAQQANVQTSISKGIEQALKGLANNGSDSAETTGGLIMTGYNHMFAQERNFTASMEDNLTPGEVNKLKGYALGAVNLAVDKGQLKKSDAPAARRNIKKFFSEAMTQTAKTSTPRSTSSVKQQPTQQVEVQASLQDRLANLKENLHGSPQASLNTQASLNKGTQQALQDLKQSALQANESNSARTTGGLIMTGYNHMLAKERNFTASIDSLTPGEVNKLKGYALGAVKLAVGVGQLNKSDAPAARRNISKFFSEVAQAAKQDKSSRSNKTNPFNDRMNSLETKSKRGSRQLENDQKTLGMLTKHAQSTFGKTKIDSLSPNQLSEVIDSSRKEAIANRDRTMLSALNDFAIKTGFRS